MDCKTAQLLLHFASPCRTELDAGEAEDLEGHLAECAACGAVAQAERRADNRIGQAMRAVAVPEGLRQRLLGQLDAERDAWYRRRVRRGLVAFAAAAAVLIAAWAGFVWHTNQVARVDLAAVSDDFWAYVVNPSPASVEERAHQRGLDTVAPPETLFNYRLLRYDCAAHIGSKRVPLLIFTHGDDQARVYILSAREFDLDDALGTPVVPGSGYRVEVHRGPSNARMRVAYLIVYTGESLQPFMATRPQ
jgi:hypothetical protein